MRTLAERHHRLVRRALGPVIPEGELGRAVDSEEPVDQGAVLLGGSDGAARDAPDERTSRKTNDRDRRIFGCHLFQQVMIPITAPIVDEEHLIDLSYLPDHHYQTLMKPRETLSLVEDPQDQRKSPQRILSGRS